LLGPVGLPVVDGVVGAEGARDVLLVRSARGCDYGGAEGFGNLYGGKADAAGCGVDEDPVA
jgi:hypothetical protein